MKCVCIDDDQLFWAQVGKLVDQFRIQSKIRIELQFYDKPELLLYDLKENEFYDLYLVDIVLGDKMNGLRLADEIRKIDRKAKIVFLTSHAEFALAGYDYHPYHYILKAQVGKLETVLKQIVLKLEEENDQFRLIFRRSGAEKIRYREIFYIYKRGKYSIFVCEDGRICAERKALRQIREELNAPQMLAIGKSYIINLNRIKRLDRQDIYFDQDTEFIHVSRQQAEFLKAELFRYLRGE